MSTQEISMGLGFELHLFVSVKKVGKVFVSNCPILDVASQGYTNKEAKDNLVEALQLFIISCLERGVLEKVLLDAGMRPIAVEKHRTTPIPQGCQALSVPIPFELLGTQQHCV